MTSGWIAVGLAAAAGFHLAGAPIAATRRLRPGLRAVPRPGSSRGLPYWLRRRAPPLAVLAIIVLLLTGHGLPAALLASTAAAVLVPEHRQRMAAVRRDSRVARDLPRMADLLAGVLEAGAAPHDALALVCDVVGGPLRADLLPVATSLRLGTDPDVAWSALVHGPGPVARLGRAMSRASVTGAPLAATIAGVAHDERERSRWEAEAAARRAGVRAVGPLAACFLPAFLLLGVVPVVAGVAGQVLGDLT